MGRVRAPLVRSRARWYWRVLLDPAALRYWLVVAALAVVVGATVAGALDRAARARARWGDTTEVWVAAEDLAAGDAVADAVRPVEWPTALAPPTAAGRIDDGARVALAVAEGQVITADALDPEAGPAALAGRRTVAVDRGEAPLPVEVGERVDVWGVVDPSLVAADGEPTRRLAAGAVVVGVSERTVTVAVEPDEVADVAAAAAVAATALSGRP